jgi:hypothetical protein
MIYDPESLPFWEQQNPGPIAKHVAVMRKHATGEKLHAIEKNMILLRLGTDASNRGLQRRRDEKHIKRLANQWRGVANE